MANLFIGDRFDPQELKVKISKDVSKYCDFVSQGLEQRPLCNMHYSHPSDLLFDRVFQHKAPLILHMIAAKIGGDHLKSVIQQFLKRGRFLATNLFVAMFKRSAGISIKEFAVSWVYGTGAPLLDCSFVYNKREN
jgi:aminopeptidase N